MKKASAGDFSDDLSDWLIVLNVVSYGWGGCQLRCKQQQTLHISANALLSHIRVNPSGGTVPWGEWGPGNFRVVPHCVVAYETVVGMHSLCGLCVLSDHIIWDRYKRPAICVYDYHCGRVGKAAAHCVQWVDGDAPNGGDGRAGLWTRMLPTKHLKTPLSAAMSYVLPDGCSPCCTRECLEAHTAMLPTESSLSSPFLARSQIFVTENQFMKLPTHLIQRFAYSSLMRFIH